MKTITLIFASFLCFAADPAGIDFSQKLISPDRTPLLNDVTSKPGAPAYLTLAFVASQCLYATLRDDTPDRKRDHDMAALAQRITDAGNKPLLLTNDESKLILDRLYKVFPKITAYAAECILDPGSCKSVK